MDNIKLKSLHNEFAIIKLFENSDRIKCKILNNNISKFNKKAVITKNLDRNDYFIELTVQQNFIFSYDMQLDKVENIEIEIEGVKYIIANASITNKTRQAGEKSNMIKIIAKFDVLTKHKDNSKKSLRRLVIPCEIDLTFHFFFENLESIKTSKKVFPICLLLVEIDSFRFEIFKMKEDESNANRHFIIIDSKCNMTLEEFKSYAYSILIGLGYITGCFVQNRGFYFSHDGENKIDEFELYFKRKSIYTHFIPVYKNPYGIFQNRDFQEQYKDIVKGFTSSEFSKLCQLINNKDEFKVLILLILESCASTQILQPAGFSVALEAFADYYKNEIEKNDQSKTDKLPSSVLKELRNVLLKNKDMIGSSFELFNKKIDQINQPTNKDTLLQPFESLCIPINEMDKVTVNHRNDFLHGRYNLKVTEDNDSYRFLIALRLYTLLSALILKYIGFNGIVINYPKKYEYLLNDKLEEDPYRLI